MNGRRAPLRRWVSAALLAALVVAAGCTGTDDGSVDDAGPGSSPGSTAEATTTSTSGAPPDQVAPSGSGPVDVASHLVTGEELPSSSASEPTGNFRAICSFSHLAYDDPIVAPGQPGASHLHAFFGNTTADAHSTYESLRSSGDSTCQGGPLNRTAYWFTAVIDGDGRVVVPEYVSIYYKGTGEAVDIAAIEPIPEGLRMIAGHDADGRGSGVEWTCEASPAPAERIPECPDDELVGVVVTFPPCWDGENLDAPDHRSHVAEKVRDDDTGRVACPGSHPVHLPELTVGIWFPHRGDSAEWHVSSDVVPGEPQRLPGSTFHSDWFGAWEPSVQATWVEHCINGLLNCVDGQLGDGTRLADGLGWDGPERIAAPPRP